MQNNNSEVQGLTPLQIKTDSEPREKSAVGRYNVNILEN